MFNEYIEYDNIDNEVYDVYNLYLKASTPSPVPSATKPLPLPTPEKKAAFTERFEQPPGDAPAFNVLESCGDACSEKKEDRTMYEGYQSKRSCSHKNMSKRMMDYYESLSFSVYEIIIFIIVIFFILHMKQRMDRLEWTMCVLLHGKQKPNGTSS